MGAIFSLLSAWWLYRGKLIGVAQVTLPLGAALIVLGAIFPRSLVYPNRAWMLLAEALAYVSTRIILGFIFFAIVAPIGMVKRVLVGILCTAVKFTAFPIGDLIRIVSGIRVTMRGCFEKEVTEESKCPSYRL